MVSPRTDRHQPKKTAGGARRSRRSSVQRRATPWGCRARRLSRTTRSPSRRESRRCLGRRTHQEPDLGLVGPTWPHAPQQVRLPARRRCARCARCRPPDRLPPAVHLRSPPSGPARRTRHSRRRCPEPAHPSGAAAPGLETPRVRIPHPTHRRGLLQQREVVHPCQCGLHGQTHQRREVPARLGERRAQQREGCQRARGRGVLLLA